MTDTTAPKCAVCLLGGRTVPATHRGSRFGLRPDHPESYYCCDCAGHRYLDPRPDPILDGAVCEVAALLRGDDLADENVPDREGLIERALAIPTTYPRPTRRAGVVR